MLEATIRQIEETLADAGNLSEAKRAELLKLLADLKTEVSGLSRTHRESALSIADKTRASADQATQENSDGPALETAVEEYIVRGMKSECGKERKESEED